MPPIAYRQSPAYAPEASDGQGLEYSELRLHCPHCAAVKAAKVARFIKALHKLLHKGEGSPVQDVKAALRWIPANTQRYHLPSDKIAAWGGSSSANLAAMLGTSAGVAELEDLSLGNPDQPGHIQAAVAWFGPTDLPKMDQQLTERGMAPTPGTEHNGANSPESLLLGEQLTKISERVNAANPETYISPVTRPFLLQHGTADLVVPVQTSIDFAAKLRQVLGEDQVNLALLEDAEHVDERFEMPENVSRVLDFPDADVK